MNLPGGPIDLDKDVKMALQKVYNIKNSDSRPFFSTNIDLIHTPISFSCYKSRRNGMDTNLATATELCSVHIKDIDYPWLIQDPEIVTPFFYAQSFLCSPIDEVRHRASPLTEMADDCDGFLKSSEALEQLQLAYCSQNSCQDIVDSTLELTLDIADYDNVLTAKQKVCQAIERRFDNKSLEDLNILIKFIETPPEPPVVVSLVSEYESCQSSSGKENDDLERTIQDEGEIELAMKPKKDKKKKKKKLKKRKHLEELSEHQSESGVVVTPKKKKSKKSKKQRELSDNEELPPPELTAESSRKTTSDFAAVSHEIDNLDVTTDPPELVPQTAAKEAWPNVYSEQLDTTDLNPKFIALIKKLAREEAENQYKRAKNYLDPPIDIRSSLLSASPGKEKAVPASPQDINSPDIKNPPKCLPEKWLSDAQVQQTPSKSEGARGKSSTITWNDPRIHQKDSSTKKPEARTLKKSLPAEIEQVASKPDAAEHLYTKRKCISRYRQDFSSHKQGGLSPKKSPVKMPHISIKSPRVKKVESSKKSSPLTPKKVRLITPHWSIDSDNLNAISKIPALVPKSPLKGILRKSKRSQDDNSTFIRQENIISPTKNIVTRRIFKLNSPYKFGARDVKQEQTSPTGGSGGSSPIFGSEELFEIDAKQEAEAPVENNFGESTEKTPTKRRSAKLPEKSKSEPKKSPLAGKNYGQSTEKYIREENKIPTKTGSVKLPEKSSNEVNNTSTTTIVPRKTSAGWDSDTSTSEDRITLKELLRQRRENQVAAERAAAQRARQNQTSSGVRGPEKASHQEKKAPNQKTRPPSRVGNWDSDSSASPDRPKLALQKAKPSAESSSVKTAVTPDNKPRKTPSAERSYEKLTEKSCSPETRISSEESVVPKSWDSDSSPSPDRLRPVLQNRTSAESSFGKTAIPPTKPSQNSSAVKGPEKCCYPEDWASDEYAEKVRLRMKTLNQKICVKSNKQETEVPSTEKAVPRRRHSVQDSCSDEFRCQQAKTPPAGKPVAQPKSPAPPRAKSPKPGCSTNEASENFQRYQRPLGPYFSEEVPTSLESTSSKNSIGSELAFYAKYEHQDTAEVDAMITKTPAIPRSDSDSFENSESELVAAKPSEDLVKKEQVVLEPSEELAEVKNDSEYASDEDVARGSSALGGETTEGENRPTVRKSKRDRLARKRSKKDAKQEVRNIRVVISPLELAEQRRQAILAQIKEFALGTFVWAAVGKFPYWPAIVCLEPNKQRHYVEGKNKKNQTTYVKFHVRFFGDNGRRAWVSRKSLMMYYGRDDLEKLAKKFKSEKKSTKQFIVSRGQERWDRAVEELERCKCKSYKRVIKFLLKSTPVRPRSRVGTPAPMRNELDTSTTTEEEEQPPGVLPTPDVSGEVNNLNETLQEELCQMANAGEARDSSNNLEEVEADDDNPRSETCSPSGLTPPTPSYSPLTISERSLPSATIGPNSPLIHSDNANFQPDEVDEDNNNSPRRSGRSLKSVERIDMLQLRQSSSFVSDAGSISGNSEIAGDDEQGKKEGKKKWQHVAIDPSDYDFGSQMRLHKKNNLFNGMRNVKVCDYCFKPGELHKCTGRCGGFLYHVACAPNVHKPLVTRTNRKKSASKPETPKTPKTPETSKTKDECPPKGAQPSNSADPQCLVEIVEKVPDAFEVSTEPVDAVTKTAHFQELDLVGQLDEMTQAIMSEYEDGPVNYHQDSTDSDGHNSFKKLPPRRPPARPPTPPVDQSDQGGNSTEESNLSLPDPSKVPPSDSPVSMALSSDGSVIDFDSKSSGDGELLLPATSSPLSHVTADSDLIKANPNDPAEFKCSYCLTKNEPPCFSCGQLVSEKGETTRQKCQKCGRFYHLSCVKKWPQTKWNIGRWQNDNFTCPAHACQTCTAEDLGSAHGSCRLPGDRLARCLLCPMAFHTSSFCIPAGTEILGGSQIICPKHRTTPIQPINTIWCFICSKGGKLVCCETCPTSVHVECQPNLQLDDDEKYICEDCESGRFPLYDEIVWVKLGHFRWWPAVILFPNEVPENVYALRKHRGDFVVKFFGTNDHYWVNKGRVFLFQEDDKGGSPNDSKLKKKTAEIFEKAVKDAQIVYELKKAFKVRREAACADLLKPPPYVKINKNKPVGKVKAMEMDMSNVTPCECEPTSRDPCGPTSSCINRILLTECDFQICNAGPSCNNQYFQKRQYPALAPYSTLGRGWGLKCLRPIKKGQFIIEYVGELIDSEEYQKRIEQMHDKKEDNYYFMTVDSERVIDAGPKGNLSRFMNHSCNPNCITQKWTVRGDTRVGIFAKYDIKEESELTFNYNLAVVGQEKKPCKCGASNCSGFIGVKPEKAPAILDLRKSRKSTKKKSAPPTPQLPKSIPCFLCKKFDVQITCKNTVCFKAYHLKCLGLERMPDAIALLKYSCPRHHCQVCNNRTIRCCYKCNSAFCPNHADGKIRYLNYHGYVCWSHDPRLNSTTTKATKRKRTSDTPDTPRLQPRPIGGAAVQQPRSSRSPSAQSYYKGSPQPGPSRQQPSTSGFTDELVMTHAVTEPVEVRVDPPKEEKRDRSYCYEARRASFSSCSKRVPEDDTLFSSSEEEEEEEDEYSLKERLKKLKRKNAREKFKISVGGLCKRSSSSSSGLS